MKSQHCLIINRCGLFVCLSLHVHCLLESERNCLHFKIELDFDLCATSACLSQTQHKVEGGGTCSRVGDLGRLASSCRRSTCSKARSNNNLLSLQFGKPLCALCICFLYHSVNLISTNHSSLPKTTRRRDIDFFLWNIHDNLVVALSHHTSVVRILQSHF